MLFNMVVKGQKSGLGNNTIKNDSVNRREWLFESGVLLLDTFIYRYIINRSGEPVLDYGGNCKGMIILLDKTRPRRV